ncbi:MAG: TolC family outer membrane protein [Pseudomonadota bacterium]
MKQLFSRCLLIGSSLFPLSTLAADNLWIVYQQARQADPQLQVAAANQAARYEARPRALAALRPTITLNGQLGYQRQHLAGNAADRYASNNISLNLTQPIYHRAAWLALSQVDKELVQADIQYQVAEQNLMMRLVRAYFGVLGAQDDLRFAQSEKTAIARQLEQARQRFEVGLVAMTDVHEVQARSDQASAALLSAENALDNAHEVLREMTRTPPPALARLQTDITLQAPTTDQGWVAQARTHNLTLRSAELVAMIAQDSVGIQQSAHYPTLALTASLSRSDTRSRTGMDNTNRHIGLQLSVPIYQGGSVQAQVRQARFAAQAAQAELTRQQHAVERQVSTAYRGIQTSIGRVQALQAAQVSAQSALDATRAGFDAGTRTLVDVLNSQRDLYRARRDYAQARYQYVLSTLSLYQAVGTLDDTHLQQINHWLEPS